MNKKHLATLTFATALTLLSPTISNEHSMPSTFTAHAEAAKAFTNISEANTWGEKQIKAAKFSSKDKMALYNYTKNSAPINTPLRTAKGVMNAMPSDVQDKVRQLDSTIAKTTTPEAIIVHRLLNLDYLTSIAGFTEADLHQLYTTQNGAYDAALVSKLNNLMSSRIYREDGYSSTQLVKGAAVGGRPIEMRLELPKGTKAAYIDSKELTAYPGQQEILLPRATEYAVASVQLSSDKKRIIIDAVVFKK